MGIISLADLFKNLQKARVVHWYYIQECSFSRILVLARINPEISPTSFQKAVSYGMDELTKTYDNWEIICY